MRCQKCGRMLLNPGVEVQMHGFVLTVGPTCARKMGAKPPTKKRATSLFSRVPRRRLDQRDLFEVSA